MSNPIPKRARAVIKERDGGHCLRCGAGGGIEVHHRRRRGIGEDPHAYCNLMSLCATCHPWVHAHPELARAAGFIVSMHVDYVCDVRVNSFMGPILLAGDGGLDWV